MRISWSWNKTNHNVPWEVVRLKREPLGPLGFCATALVYAMLDVNKNANREGVNNMIPGLCSLTVMEVARHTEIRQQNHAKVLKHEEY